LTNKQSVIYIADNQGKLINKGIVVSMAINNNGDIIIKAKEQHKYNYKNNKRKTMA